MPTRTRVVQARAAADEVRPPSRKQSSQSHSSSTPARSAATATDRRRSGGRAGTKIAPTTVMPSSCQCVGSGAGSTSSTRTPPASFGCTKLILLPAVPRLGSG